MHGIDVETRFAFGRMPVKGDCYFCAHPKRLEIEASARVERPYRAICAQHGGSPATLSRHLQNHVQEPFSGRADDETLIPGADAAIAELKSMARRTRRSKAVGAGALLLKISAELRSWIALKAQLGRRQLAPLEQRSVVDGEEVVTIAGRGEEKDLSRLLESIGQIYGIRIPETRTIQPLADDIAPRPVPGRRLLNP